MRELKPCPFCGGEAKMESDVYVFGRHQNAVAKCSCSVCRVSRLAVLDSGRSLGDAEAEAANIWNRRAERTCPHYDSSRHYCSVHDYVVDRDALLALADEIHGLVENQETRFFHVVQVHESTLSTIERCIREACGEGEG